MSWQKFLKGKLKINERLAKHTSFKIGGPVQFWVEPEDLSDLKNLVLLARKKKIPLRIIGAGSNILVNDRGIKGIVVRLNSPYFKRIRVNQQIISAGAGLNLAQLVRYAQKFGLSGFELLAGIPGTVGGALIMNAANIGNKVLDVAVMDKLGRIKILKRQNTQFNYRSSNLNRYVILSAHFKLITKDRETINKSINDYLDYRQKTQDLSKPSAGCIFKNPSFDALRSLRMDLERSRMGPDSPSAAYFIERCGLKGSSFGDAAVSFKHANFVIICVVDCLSA